MNAYDAAPLLKVLARGRHGSRDLTREQSGDLFGAIFRGEVEDVALGAILVALRMKGESLAELTGMLDALATHVGPLRLRSGRGPLVLIPSYNGARRLPNLTPLLALLLAREGVPVLVHGMRFEAGRVDAFAILGRLGHARAGDLADAERRLEQTNLAAVELDLLSPALARLLALRGPLGVRNVGHTLAKLLLPQNLAPAQALRLVPVTHPEFMALMGAHLAEGNANALLLRGVEGEAVVRLHAPQPIEYFGLDGSRHVHQLALDDIHDPETLPARDAESTATWTAQVLAGARPVPPAIALQVEFIRACTVGCGERSEPHRSAEQLAPMRFAAPTTSYGSKILRNGPVRPS